MPPVVELKPLCADHTQALFDLTEANRAHLKRWLPWLDQVRTSDDTRAFLQTVSGRNASGDAYQCAILCEGAIVGVVGFHAIDKAHRCSTVGYWLGERHTGRGIMTAAVTELVRIGFEELDLHRIEVRCAVGNTKSRAIPERLGFRREGTLRHCEWLYDRFVDLAVYSLLAGEHEASLDSPPTSRR